MKKLLLILVLPFIAIANDDRPPITYDFLSKPQTQQFIRKMAITHGFEEAYLAKVLKDARLDRDTLDRYTGRYKQNSTVGTWQRFKAHVLDPISLEKAKKFNLRYAKTLQKAEHDYKVDAAYIVGFIGVESKFGEFSGDYRLLDSLSTLAFHKNRMQKFFLSELEQFFLMCREEGFNPYILQGSFAGAMGYVQQVPSIYRKYGMDYDKDGKKDPWSAQDAIGIIARFMHQNGWRQGTQVAVASSFINSSKRFNTLNTGFKTHYKVASLVKYGIKPKKKFPFESAGLIRLYDKDRDELWLTGPNFRVLTRYNPSANYAMAIHKIAEYVKKDAKP